MLEEDPEGKLPETERWVTSEGGYTPLFCVSRGNKGIRKREDKEKTKRRGRRSGKQAREGLAGERGRGGADRSQSMILQYLLSVDMNLMGTGFETGTRREESGTQDPGRKPNLGHPHPI
jgi:hypothetical protein